MNRRNSLKVGASIMAGIAVAPRLNALEVADNNQPMESFWDVVKNRRSVRQFRSDPVPEEHLLKIVDAARMCPTSGNQQPWKFLIVQDKKQIEILTKECVKNIETYLKENQKLTGAELEKKLKETEERYTTGYLSAPAFIVVLTDGKSTYPSYNHHDGPLAAGYLMLAARALGYGTVYITDAISEEVTRKAFNIPEQYTRVCITPVGIPVEWPIKKKKSLDGFIVNERF